MMMIFQIRAQNEADGGEDEGVGVAHPLLRPDPR